MNILNDVLMEKEDRMDDWSIRSCKRRSVFSILLLLLVTLLLLLPLTVNVIALIITLMKVISVPIGVDVFMWAVLPYTTFIFYCAVAHVKAVV